VDLPVQEAAVLLREILGRQDHDRNRPPLFVSAQLGHELEAVQFGHHQVEQDQVGTLLLDAVSPSLAVLDLNQQESTASGGETPPGSAVPGVKMGWSSLREAPWGRRTARKPWPSQALITWDCPYHVAILPKDRYQVSSGRRRRGSGQILRDRCRPKKSAVGAGPTRPDPLPRLLRGPPRSRLARTIGDRKGPRATRIPRAVGPTNGTWFGRRVWARGACVRPVGRAEEQLRRDLREQEKFQRDQDQGELNRH
jgi:REP-associated tyrosine transposase